MLPKWHPICMRTGRITPQVTHRTKYRKIFCGKLLESGHLNLLLGLFLAMPLRMQGFRRQMLGFRVFCVGYQGFLRWWLVSGFFARVAERDFSPPVRWGLLDFMSVCFSSSSSSSSPPGPPRPPRRQLRWSKLDVSCRISTAMMWAQCFLPDLNGSSVFLAGPQSRSCELSVPCRTSTAMMWAQCWVPNMAGTHVLSQQGRNECARKVSTCRPDPFPCGVVFQCSKFFANCDWWTFHEAPKIQSFFLDFSAQKNSPQFSLSFFQ